MAVAVTPNKRKPVPEAISIRRAAEILSVHHSTVRRWIRRGFMRAHRVGPQVIRIPRSEIARLRAVRMPVVHFGDQPEYPHV